MSSDSDDDDSLYDGGGYITRLRQAQAQFKGGLHDAAEAGDTGRMKLLLFPVQEVNKAEEEAEEEMVDGMEVESPDEAAVEEEKARRRRDIASLAGEDNGENEEEDEDEDESYQGDEDDEDDDDDGDEEEEVEEEGEDGEDEDDDDDDDEEEEVQGEENDKVDGALKSARDQAPAIAGADINERDNFYCTPLHVALHAR